MSSESLALHRPESPAIEIDWNVIQAAGDTVMREDVLQGKQIERGFALGGVIKEVQGQMVLKVTSVIDAGTGTSSTFDVDAALAERISNHPYAEGERFMGFAHSHPEPYSSQPSSADYEYARRLTNQKVCMVLKVNPDGGGNISVFNGDGLVDYDIVGNDTRQSFTADTNRVVDVDALRSPGPRPEPQALAA